MKKNWGLGPTEEIIIILFYSVRAPDATETSEF